MPNSDVGCPVCRVMTEIVLVQQTRNGGQVWASPTVLKAKQRIVPRQSPLVLSGPFPTRLPGFIGSQDALSATDTCTVTLRVAIAPWNARKPDAILHASIPYLLLL